MNAPADFVVSRHLLSHPHDSPADVANHVGLQRPVAYNVFKRLHENDLLQEGRLLHHLQHHPRNIQHKSHHFRVPNPQQWINQFSGHPLLSGDIVAAEHDGYNIVPNLWIAYVRPDQEKDAIQAALDVFADFAPKNKANLLIRIADPWLRPDENDPKLAERGQRLLDYSESPMLQLVGRPR